MTIQGTDRKNLELSALVLTTSFLPNLHEVDQSSSPNLIDWMSWETSYFNFLPTLPDIDSSVLGLGTFFQGLDSEASRRDVTNLPSLLCLALDCLGRHERARLGLLWHL